MRFLSLIEISIFMDFQKGLGKLTEHLKISKNSQWLQWVATMGFKNLLQGFQYVASDFNGIKGFLTS